jgi:hypothetical protein
MLLEHAQLPDEVELEAKNGRLIVRAFRGTPAGWAEAAKAMHARGEDGLLDAPASNEFDDKDWEWRRRA